MRNFVIIDAILQTAQDIQSPPDKFVIDIMLAAMQARCVPYWRLDPHLPRSAKRESNSCSFVSHRWRQRQVTGFKALAGFSNALLNGKFRTVGDPEHSGMSS